MNILKKTNKSDELVFDSERQEETARKKRLLIPLLALAGILLLVVVIALIVRSGNKPVHTEAGDSKYPFTWQVRKDGSVCLEISHADASDFRWTVANAEELRIVEAEREKKDKNNVTTLILTGKEAGREKLDLLLLREPRQDAAESASEEEKAGRRDAGQEAADAIYRLSVLVEFTWDGEELVGAVLGSYGVQRQGLQDGGTESANPYKIYAKAENRVVIEVRDENMAMDWKCEILSGVDSVDGEALMYGAGWVRLHLTAGETPGESELRLKSQNADAELSLRCGTQEDGSLLILEHKASYGENNLPPASGEESAEQTESEDDVAANITEDTEP